MPLTWNTRHFAIKNTHFFKKNQTTDLNKKLMETKSKKWYTT
jgi:hypothetical protein